ncbi:hypothetical protein HJC23_007524, partial [Cyclotella cryptica]
MPSCQRSIHHKTLHRQHPENPTPSLLLPSSSFSFSSKSSLLKLSQPFLLTCQPDAMSHNNDTDTTHNGTTKKRTSPTSKQVNLQAVQTLNGLIDTCDEWIHQCCGTSTTSTTAAPPLPKLYEQYAIEFLLPDVGNGGGGSEWTMCSIILEFPRECWDHVRPCAHGHRHHRDKNEEGNSKASLAGRTLKQHTERELRRLLTMAGLEYEGVSEEELGTMQYDNNDEGTNWFGSKSRKKGPEEWTLLDHFLYELGIELKADLSSSTSSHEQYGKSFAFYGRNASRGGKRSKRYDAPPTYSHYEEAWEDAQADFSASRMNLFTMNTREGRERREVGYYDLWS